MKSPVRSILEWYQSQKIRLGITVALIGFVGLIISAVIDGWFTLRASHNRTPINISEAMPRSAQQISESFDDTRSLQINQSPVSGPVIQGDNNVIEQNIAGDLVFLPPAARNGGQQQINQPIVSTGASDFANLVRLLERQLAPEDAEVLSPGTVVDRESGHEIDVPILIKYELGTHSLRLAVEYLDEAEQQEAGIIGELHAKYVGTDIAKLVAVARSGFSIEAARKAHARNIDLLSLTEAQQKDWVKVVDSLRTTRFELYVMPELVSAELLIPSDVQLPEASFRVRDTVLIRSNGISVPMTEWVDGILHSEMVRKQLMNEKAKGMNRLDVRYVFRSEAKLQILGENLVPVHEVILNTKYSSVITDRPFTRASYGDAQIAHTSAEIAGHKFTFVITETEQDGAKGGISVRQIDKDEKESPSE